MRENIKLVLTAAWTMAGTAAYLIVPAVATFFLPLTMVAPILWYRQKGLLRHLWARSWLARLLALASAYLLINTTWSLTPDRAYVGVATFFVAAVALHVVVRTMPTLEPRPLRAMAIGFYAAYAIVAFLTSIEILFDHPLHLRFFAAFPKLVPQMDEIVIQAGVVRSLPDFFLNRSIAALVFLLWPVLLVASRLTASTRSRVILLACLLPVIPAVLASQHETSKIALAGAVAVFCIQTLAPRVGKPLMTAAWTIACLAVVPLAYMAYDAQLYRARWLPSSATAPDRHLARHQREDRRVTSPRTRHGLGTGARAEGKGTPDICARARNTSSRPARTPTTPTWRSGSRPALLERRCCSASAFWP